MGNASSVKESTSAQTLGLAKAASAASRFSKKARRNTNSRNNLNLAAAKSHIDDEELAKVYRVFRGSDSTLKRASFISIVKGGNVEKYNSRNTEELDIFLDKLPEQLTLKDFKYFMRTISEKRAPERGISVRALAKFMTAHKFQKYSIEQFISRVVLPQTSGPRCSFASLFAEYVDQEPAAVVAPVGTVTHFVSLSNSNKPPLSSVVNSLIELEKTLFSSEPGNVSTGAAMYVWLDMLCLNLHEVTDSYEDSASQRHWQLEDQISITDKVIEHAKHVVLFLDNWRNPSVFSDGPCLCELFLAKVHSKRPRLLVDLAEKDAFEEAVLAGSFADTQRNLKRAQNLTNAHFATRSERSRWENFTRVRNEAVGSTLKVNEVVHQSACSAFLDVGVEIYKSRSHEKRSGGDYEKWRIEVAKNAGTLAFNIEEYETAQFLFQKALESTVALHSADSAETMCLKLLLLDVMEKMGTSLLSMHSAFEEALKLSKKYNGKLHPRTLDLMMKFARNLEDMGDLEQSVDQYKACLEDYEAAKGRDDELTLQACFAVGSVLQQLGQSEDANFYYHRSVSRFEKLFGPMDSRTLAALGYFAEVKEDVGALKAAEDLLRQRLNNANAKHADDAELAVSYHDLAAFLTRHGEKFNEDEEYERMEEAAELYEHAIRIRTDVLGGTNEDTWMSTNNLALVLQRLDRVDEAEMVFRKAIQAMQEPTANDDDQFRVIKAKYNLAVMLLNSSELDKSEVLFDQLVEYYSSRPSRTPGQEEHFTTVLRNFGNLLLMKSEEGSSGSLDKAVRMYQLAMAIFRKYPDEQGWTKHKCLMTRDLAICYDKLGERKRAHKEYRAAYTLCQTHLGVLNRKTIEVAQHFADFCMQGATADSTNTNAIENVKEARALIQRLLDNLQKDNPCPDFLVDGEGVDVDTSYQQDIFDAANTLGLLCNTLGDDTEAERNYKLAREGNAQLFGHDHVNVLTVSYSLAQLYIKMGKLEEARELLEDVMKGYRYLYGEISLDTLEVTHKSAWCAKELGDLSYAFALYQDAIDGYAELEGEDALETVRCVAGLAGCLQALGKPVEAETQYTKALEGYVNALGKDHSETKQIQSKLKKLKRRSTDTPASRLLGKNLWQPNKANKNSAIFSNRSNTVDALLEHAQNDSFAPKVFRPMISSGSVSPKFDFKNKLKSTAGKLLRETKKSKSRGSSRSHKKKKKSPSSDSSSVSFDTGYVPKHSSRKKDKKIAGPKALAKNSSEQEDLTAEDDLWQDQSVFIDSDESDADDDQDQDIAALFQEEKKAKQAEQEEDKAQEDIDDLLRDVMGFDALKI